MNVQIFLKEFFSFFACINKSITQLILSYVISYKRNVLKVFLVVMKAFFVVKTFFCNKCKCNFSLHKV